jgi:hypothetical protein
VTTLLDDRGAVVFTAEGGGWLSVRRPEPALRGQAPAELLRLTAKLPGNLRYATDPAGPFLIGEVRAGGSLSDATERKRLLGPSPVAAEPPPDEVIEAALDGSGFPWSRRASCWPVVVTERLPREVLMRPVAGGARAETVLAEWDDIAPVCAEALAEFLVGAQAGLRFARCELDERHARLVAFAAGDALDADLAHALLGVAAGCELLAREAAALLRPEVAENYLNCRRMPFGEAGQTRSDIPAAAGRGKLDDPRETDGR